jgi:hypothetical protein
MNTLKELNLSSTYVAIVWDNKAASDIGDNHKIGNRSKHINVWYNLLPEIVAHGLISLLQVESGEYLTNINTKVLLL